MALQTTPIAKKQIPDTHKQTKWEEAFFMQSMRQLCDTTTELLEAVFSMRSMPRCYKQDKSTV
jgi:hypothetical protein